MKTVYVNPKDMQRKWYVIDAEGVVLGRLAVEVAKLLRGKHKPEYAPHQEIGDYVVVINAGKIRVTGRKPMQKMYHHHSGYPGALKSTPFGKMIANKPTFPVEHAIKGMLPKNRLGRKLFTNVKVYAGSTHPHLAQQPESFVVE
ncbi:MAG: 50S ribosomal protein L13 [Spirochaetales bacterium]|nr:50S ribosomal protein L13 [Spirochaetales bacterium]